MASFVASTQATPFLFEACFAIGRPQSHRISEQQLSELRVESLKQVTLLYK